MGSAPQTPPTIAEDEDTGTDVDVHVDQPSLITSSVETTAPAVGGHVPLPADSEGQTLQHPSSARLAAAQAVGPEGQARGRMDSLAEITTAHGLSAGPVSIRNAAQQSSSPVGSLERALASVIDDDPSISMITPRFEANALVHAELAFADTALGEKKDGLFDDELPATSEPDTVELGTIQKPIGVTALPKQATMRTATARDIGEDPTLQRDPEPRLSPAPAPLPPSPSEADAEDSTLDARDLDPPTLDPPLGPNPEDDRTRPRVDQERLIAHLPPEQEQGPNIVDLPPMRPKLDSEAAGHWPPWHAQSEEAQAALRNVVSSPVSSGTEAIPKAIIREAIEAVDSNKAKSLAAATDELLRASAEPPPPGNTFSPKQTQPMPIALMAPPAQTPRERKPRLPHIPAPEPRPGSTSDATPSGRSASGRRDDKSSVSPVTVFVVTFLLVGGVLGGLIAAQQFGWFGFFSASKGGAIDPSPSATASSLTSPPSPSDSAAASASASASKSPKTKPSAAPSSSSHRRRH